LAWSAPEEDGANRADLPRRCHGVIHDALALVDEIVQLFVGQLTELLLHYVEPARP
jgi:hypothetical protein